MTAKAKKVQLDDRYSITRCWTGHAQEQWVARFCGAWIGSSANWRDAADQAVTHRANFLVQITAAVLPAAA